MKVFFKKKYKSYFFFEKLVPNDYYSPLDSNGVRQDINERPELLRGCVEFIAPSEYMVRPPQPPSYFFIFDVSYPAIHSGMFHTAVHTIKQLLNNFPGDVRTRIGFITYDSFIHFYNLKVSKSNFFCLSKKQLLKILNFKFKKKSSLNQAQMLVVSDLEEVFLPIPDNLLVNLYDSKKIINGLLEKFPAMFQSTQNTGTALGVALKAASMVVVLSIHFLNFLYYIEINAFFKIFFSLSIIQEKYWRQNYCIF